MNLLKSEPMMSEEFCYLEKRNHAYDYVIEEFDKRNEKNYMTLS